MPLKKVRVVKKLTALEEKQKLYQQKGEILDVFLKFDKAYNLIKQKKKLSGRNSFEQSFAELKAISIKIKKSNISEIKKQEILKKLQENLKQELLKIKEVYPFPEKLKKIERYIISIYP